MKRSKIDDIIVQQELFEKGQVPILGLNFKAEVKNNVITAITEIYKAAIIGTETK